MSDDYVMVPREPTPEMLAVVRNGPMCETWTAGYRAMIAAAPPAAPADSQPCTTKPVVSQKAANLTDNADMVMVPRNHGLCTYPHCNGERPDDGGCCGRPFTSAMADAAERYWRTVGPSAHPLPAQFRWSECFRAMIAAAPAPVVPDLMRDKALQQATALESTYNLKADKYIAGAVELLRQWPAPVVPLTDEQFADIVAEASLAVDLAANPLKLLAFAREVLKAHGIGGGNG